MPLAVGFLAGVCEGGFFKVPFLFCRQFHKAVMAGRATCDSGLGKTDPFGLGF